MTTAPNPASSRSTPREKVWLEIQNGPGEVVGQGAVKPKGKPDAAVSIPLAVWEARKLTHAALAYIRAWEVGHLLDLAPVAPVGDVAARVSTAAMEPPPPVETVGAGQKATGVTTAPEVFSSPDEAIDWSFEAGAFKARKDAESAYNKLEAEKKSTSAREMARLWVADVRRRLAATAAD